MRKKTARCVARHAYGIRLTAGAVSDLEASLNHHSLTLQQKNRGPNTCATWQHTARPNGDIRTTLSDEYCRRVSLQQVQLTWTSHLRRNFQEISKVFSFVPCRNVERRLQLLRIFSLQNSPREGGRHFYQGSATASICYNVAIGRGLLISSEG